MEEEIHREIEETILVKQRLMELVPSIEQAVQLMIRTLRSGGKIIIFGNGGSAADAQHIAAELVGRFEKERQAIPCIALTTNTSNLTAIANDYGFSAVFRRQLEAFVAPGDTVIGISTSGNSPNVLEALEKAREKGASLIGMSGEKGGRMEELTDVCLKAPSSRTCKIQECHITIGHILCHQIERHLGSNR